MFVLQDTGLQNGLVGSPCSPRDSQESSPTPQSKSINSLVLSLLHSAAIHGVTKSRAQLSDWTELNWFRPCCCCSVAKLCPALCNPMDFSMLGSPVLHYLAELAQIHVHWVSDAIRPPSSVVSFSFCLQSFPASGSFPVSRLFQSGGRSIAASAWVSGYSGLISFSMDWFDMALSCAINVSAHHMQTFDKSWRAVWKRTWELKGKWESNPFTLKKRHYINWNSRNLLRVPRKNKQCCQQDSGLLNLHPTRAYSWAYLIPSKTLHLIDTHTHTHTYTHTYTHTHIHTHIHTHTYTHIYTHIHTHTHTHTDTHIHTHTYTHIHTHTHRHIHTDTHTHIHTHTHTHTYTYTHIYTHTYTHTHTLLFIILYIRVTEFAFVWL